MEEVLHDDLIYVAVGKNVEESRLNLIWVLQSLQPNKLCLLHVHQPTTDMTPSSSGLETDGIEAIQEAEWNSVYGSLHEYACVCELQGMNLQDLDFSCFSMTDVGEGIVEHIYEKNIKKLVMGAAADAHYTQGMNCLKSRKSEYVSEHAPQSCQIWFVCRGHLIVTEHGQFDRVDETEPNTESSVSSSSLSSSSADLSSALIPRPSEGNSDRRNDDGISRQLQSDGENVRRESVQESIERYESKIKAIESVRKTREYEAMYREQLRLRTEIERNLLKEKEGHEKAKIERDEAVSKSRLKEEECEKLKREKESLHKDLEEAVSNLMDSQQLLMYYKNEQDRIQEERDNAIRGMEELLKITADGDSGSDDHQPPSYFLCPISQEIMEDPQFAADGFTYEAETVREWFKRGNKTSPMTNLELQHLHLVPNLSLRSAIQEWLLRHPDYS